MSVALDNGVWVVSYSLLLPSKPPYGSTTAPVFFSLLQIEVQTNIPSHTLPTPTFKNFQLVTSTSTRVKVRLLRGAHAYCTILYQ